MMVLVEVMVNKMINRDLVRNCDEALDAVLLTDLDAVLADNYVRYVKFSPILCIECMNSSKCLPVLTNYPTNT